MKEKAIQLLDHIEKLEAENAALKGIMGGFNVGGQPVDWRPLLKQSLQGQHIQDTVHERYAQLRRSILLATDDNQAALALVSQFRP